jgi:ATP-dependent RNA helicase RhlE
MINDEFKRLGLARPILKAVEDEGYEEPTDIQREAIPMLMDGEDLLATAQTGTGKTAAFSLPILHQLYNDKPKGERRIRALVLAPTRELALQVEESFRTYGRNLPLRTAVILGGVPHSTQIRALRKKPDILVATPGRLIDLVDQRLLNLRHVEMLVLDEADRMLDMGFINDVRRIVSELPKERQTMLFSATLSFEIAELASRMLQDPAHVEVTPAHSVSIKIEQKVLFVRYLDKPNLLRHVLETMHLDRVLVFTRTKRRAEDLAIDLTRAGISADSIHSNKSQQARQRALAKFHKGKTKVLVATDIVARGIDVEGISHVINYEMPNDPESYVHRIGRTARAGADGIALSFCDAEDLVMLRAIERLTKEPLAAIEDHPFHAENICAIRNRRSATRRGGLSRRKAGARRPRRAAR